MKAILLMEIEAVPAFVRVATLGPPAFPTATLLQLRDVGEMVAVPAGATPVPDKPTDSGLLPLRMLHAAE